jgi:KDO2-lipid IV(A) lauroyltransferase
MKKKYKHRIEYAVLFFITNIILYLPNFFIKIFSRCLAFLFKNIIKYRESVIEKNLKIAFPEKSDIERNTIKNGFYRYFPRFLLEFMKAPQKKSDKFIQKYVEIHNHDVFEKLKENPGIILSGHIGEYALLMNVISNYLERPLHMIMKRQKNPYSNEMMIRQRKVCGQIPHDSKNVIKSLLKVLHNKEYVGFLNDQRAGKNGMNSKFFGEEVSTMIGLPVLKYRTDVPIYFSYCVFNEKGKYDVFLQELEIEKFDEQEEYFLEILNRSNFALETAIRKHPDQYLWSHKRWNIKY